MGGGRITPLRSTPEEEESSVEQDVSQLSSSPLKPAYLQSDEEVDTAVNGENGSEFGGFDEAGRDSPSSLVFEANQKKRCKAYREVLQSYDQLQIRSRSLKEAKRRILSYTPGAWLENLGGIKLSDCNVPDTTTLLVIGPKGSGKSSLVNRISDVFEDGIFAPERAQVSYNYSAENGTTFLQEHMIPRGSTSFCLYDTRGLSDDPSENIKMIRNWIKKGVNHGKRIIRPSDSSSLRANMRCRARNTGSRSKDTRIVNFVIFVVDGLAVLKSMDIDEGTSYTRGIAETFNCPYLSFKDDKPVVVVTHGDLLSLAERTRVRVYLGELLGIPPVKQIFDIPESCDPATELTIVEMLWYSLEHAEKNLPSKDGLAAKVRKISSTTRTFLFLIFVIVIMSIWIQRAHVVRATEPKVVCASKPKVDIDWRTRGRLWLVE